MGLWDKIKKRESASGSETRNDRSPNIDRPTHVVSYVDEDGKRVELQTYSAVAAEEIKRDHPNAKITPKRG